MRNSSAKDDRRRVLLSIPVRGVCPRAPGLVLASEDSRHAELVGEMTGNPWKRRILAFGIALGPALGTGRSVMPEGEPP
ncbi:MAG: hypothetical protein ABW292_05920 [Vicinamibacterales bacterium]